LLATCSTACASCLITFIVGLWPLIFTEKRSWYTNSGLGFEWPVLLLIFADVLAFLYSGAIAVGAVKMQSVESYRWATAGTFMMINPVNWLLTVPTFTWFYKFLWSILEDNMLALFTILLISAWYVYVGFINLKTLRLPEVIAGFEEKSLDY